MTPLESILHNNQIELEDADMICALTMSQTMSARELEDLVIEMNYARIGHEHFLAYGGDC